MATAEMGRWRVVAGHSLGLAPVKAIPPATGRPVFNSLIEGAETIVMCCEDREYSKGAFPGQILRASTQVAWLSGVHGVGTGFISFQKWENGVVVQDPSNSRGTILLRVS